MVKNKNTKLLPRGKQIEKYDRIIKQKTRESIKFVNG